MEPLNPTLRTNNPEAVVQKAIIAFLEQRGWTVMPTHGNAMQKGFPDLYCYHKDYGQRWIEIKYMESYSFTRAQKDFFPLINAAGIGIWIMTEPSVEQYAELWKHYPKGNWEEYYRARQMLGARNKAHLVKAKTIKCVCGSKYDLRPSEKTTCNSCRRTVRGR